MRCKKHPTDTTGTVGVCASCLRERLFNLIAAQTQADLAQAQAQYHQHRQGHPHHSQPYFPRSVSPYVTTRKSDTNLTSNHHQHHQITFPFPRFFSTPQFGLHTTSTAASDSAKKKKGGGKFSVIKNLFRFTGSSKTTSSSKITDPCSSSLPVTQNYGRPCRMMDRGMSPVRSSSHAESDILNGFLPKSPLQSGSRLPSHNRRGLFNRQVSWFFFKDYSPVE